MRWLEEIWPTLEEPFLYIASDDLPTVTETFAKYNPATIHDFGFGISHPEADFFRDWYALTRCQYLAMPNSTFSFSAALFADPTIQCFRSSLLDRGFIPLDPWDAQPLLTGPEAIAANFPDIPGLIDPLHPKSQKRRLRSLVHGIFLDILSAASRGTLPVRSAWPGPGNPPTMATRAVGRA